ncbi:hypothetical protein WMY93_028134 [Mugilogobius chulae]|uniref:G domain-containing protein n=1 Tax=Mugilogobius chulae TaxID=88201 RepID=A0AAW0MNH4_9GOBI
MRTATQVTAHLMAQSFPGEKCPGGASQLRVLLYGPAGSGKSAFVDSVAGAVDGQSVTLTEAGAQRFGRVSDSSSFTSHTLKLKGDEDTEIPVVFNDVTWLSEDGRGVGAEDVRLILKGHVKDNYMVLETHRSWRRTGPGVVQVLETCRSWRRAGPGDAQVLDTRRSWTRAGPGHAQFNPVKALQQCDEFYRKDPCVDHKVHVVVCFLDAKSANANDSTVLQKLKEMMDAATDLGIPHVAIVSHIDHISAQIQDDIKKVFCSQDFQTEMEKFSAALGIPPNNIFPVWNNYAGAQEQEAHILLLEAFATILVLRPIEAGVEVLLNVQQVGGLSSFGPRSSERCRCSSRQSVDQRGAVRKAAYVGDTRRRKERSKVRGNARRRSRRKRHL